MGPSGLTSLFLKVIGDDAYYDISTWMRDTSLEYDTIGVMDKKGREHGYAFLVNLKGTVMAADVTNLLLILDSLLSNSILVKAQANNGNTFTSAAVSATLGYMGVQAHLELGGNFTQERFVSFTLSWKLLKSDFVLASTNSLPATGTPNAADTLYKLLSLVRADIVPGAITTFEIREAASSADPYTHLLRHIRDFKITADTMGGEDAQGRILPSWFEVAFEGVGMQASQTEVADFDDIAMQENDFRFTTADAGTLTFNNLLGTHLKLENSGDFSTEAVIRFSGGGEFVASSWDGIFTVAPP
jgi:hypothetical protein